MNVNLTFKCYINTGEREGMVERAENSRGPSEVKLKERSYRTNKKAFVLYINGLRNYKKITLIFLN